MQVYSNLKSIFRNLGTKQSMTIEDKLEILTIYEATISNSRKQALQYQYLYHYLVFINSVLFKRSPLVT